MEGRKTRTGDEGLTVASRELKYVLQSESDEERNLKKGSLQV
jgi:hypothetical protein